METRKYDKYVKRALRMKALHAKIIPAESIRVEQWVREKCRFGCGSYGTSLMCPPHTPTPAETQEVIDAYSWALLIHGDMNTPINEIAVRLEKRMFLEGCEKALALGAGPCSLCEECPNIPGQCKHPQKARPSMEACGIDVYSTVHAHGFPLQVLTSINETPNFYALVLIE